MKPEPFAWAYQNANTEHQYLVWHKQEGGRNWMPLFTLQDIQEAILAEREACAKLCDEIAIDMWNLYKGRPPYKGNEEGRASEFTQGRSIGANDCADAILKRSST